MAALGYVGAFEGATLASIQETFHFDTNQFLAPDDGECPPLDYDELFSILRAPVAVGSGQSSGDALPLQSSNSGGGVASPAPVFSKATSASQAAAVGPSAKPHAAAAQPTQAESKSAKDASFKRVRSTNNGKNKQVQVKELEALAAQKSKDLELLLRENDELKFRRQVLEKVVKLREHQLKVMRDDQEELPQQWGTPSLPAEAAGAGAAAATCGAPGGVHVSAAATVRTGSGGCRLGSASVKLSEENRERFRSIRKSQLMQGWKHFLSEVAVPLLALEANTEDEVAATQILRLFSEASFLFKHASLLAPDTVMVVSQTHLETDALTAPDPSHWLTVIRTLELSPEQTRELHAVFRLFGDIMRGILAERKLINAHLATGLHGPHASLQAAMEQLTVSPECQMLQTIQRSMRREKSAHLLLRGFLFGHTLSVLQFVKAAVYSYPWFPDATALVATVAEMTADGEGAGLP